MKQSKAIVLSAISAAVATLLLLAGAFFEVLDLSCLFLASLALMVPLAKDDRTGSFLAYLASAILGFILTGMRLQIMLPYALFFGLHPIVNDWLGCKKIKTVPAVALKALWFVGAALIVYYFTTFFVVENPTVKKYIVPIIIVGGAIFFVFYDFVMRRMQKSLRIIIERLKL